MLCGFAVWFGVAYAYDGELTIASTGKSLPCMFGCLTSSFVPLPVSVGISLIWPAEFDFKDFLKIKRVNSSTGTDATDHRSFDEEKYFSPERVAYMQRMSRLAAWWAAATFAGQVLLWPLPMYGARFVFSKKVNIPLLV